MNSLFTRAKFFEMLKIKTIFAAIVIALTFLTSCDDDEVVPKPQPNEPIINASAGVDQTIAGLGTISLDASASTVAPQSTLSYRWKFLKKPETSATLFSNSLGKTTTFLADKPGEYKVELTVSAGAVSDKDTVLILVNATIVDEPTPTILTGDITTNQTLENIIVDPSLPDYIVTTDLRFSGKITIQPGVRIEFEEHTGLDVTGSLYANGSIDEPIVFTGKQKYKGFWRGILISSNDPENVINNSIIEYAGGAFSNELPFVHAAIALNGSDISASASSLTNSFVTESGGYGLYVKGMSTIETFQNNTFTENAGVAAFVPAQQLHKIDAASHFSGNDFNGVETGGVVTQFNAVHWNGLSAGASYFVSENLVIESGVLISSGASFHFASDVILRVQGNGFLNATGTSEKPIVFTALSNQPENYWTGILIATNHPSNKLEYCEVSYGGKNEMPLMNGLKGNIGIASQAKLIVSNSSIIHGFGWGIATTQTAQLNDDAEIANSFSNLTLGTVKKFSTETTSLAGTWVDQWSFNQGLAVIDEKFYDVNAGVWFRGAADPWTMNPKAAIGLKVNEDGSYVWTIGQLSPMNGECYSYSAEYFTGNLTSTSNTVTFNESYWRDKFYNSCDESQNVDWEVEPGTMNLNYEITMEENASGKYWKLKFFNPDNTSFSYYRVYTQE
jgi:hypothetical protein